MDFVLVLGKDLSSPFTLANDATGTQITAGVPITLGSGLAYTVRVVPNTVAVPVSTAANFLGDSLTITTTSPGDAPHLVQLNQTARGAFLSLTPLSLSTTDGLCGHVTFNNFSIINSGNVAISYAVAAPGRVGTPAGTYSINVVSGSLFGGQSQAGILEIKTPGTCPRRCPSRSISTWATSSSRREWTLPSAQMRSPRARCPFRRRAFRDSSPRARLLERGEPLARA